MSRAAEVLSLPAVLLAIWAQLLAIWTNHRNARGQAASRPSMAARWITGESRLPRPRDTGVCGANLGRGADLARDRQQPPPPLDEPEPIQAWSL